MFSCDNSNESVSKQIEIHKGKELVIIAKLFYQSVLLCAKLNLLLQQHNGNIYTAYSANLILHLEIKYNQHQVSLLSIITKIFFYFL